MKIGIITFYYNNNNFGGQLQARALVRAISGLGKLEVEQIPYDYVRAWKKIPYKTRFLKSICQAFSGGASAGIEFLILRVKERKKLNLNADIRERMNVLLKRREMAFAEFSEETPHNKKVFDNDNISETLEEYDCFICGGDQIWNDWSDWFIYNALDNFSLKFVPNSIKKFSYAPSVPIEKVRRVFINRLANNLSRLDDISIRERSSVELLEKAVNRKVQVVVDPVLLLNKEQWDKEMKLKKISEKYIFCYLLGEEVKKRSSVVKFAKRMGYKLVTIPHVVDVTEEDQGFGDIQDFTSGPAEFLSLIKNAEIIITDSFHAAVFSMIYHKPFYVLERETKVSGGSMGSRLIDFLSEYGLMNQKVKPEELETICTFPYIDYTYAESILEKRRAESYKYLEENIRK